MLKTTTGIASCLGVAVAAGALAPEHGVMAATAGYGTGIAINFGHELCKRFHERAGAFVEKTWGLDKNEHIRQGIRRAQIAATRDLLREWRRQLPHSDVADEDRSRVIANLLAAWCDREDKD